MTARLKRKLERGDDIDGAGNLNESFVSYGTALPSLADNKRDKNEFVPVHQQIVTDEKGRRRLHGAFTGGFSAGYFNSVGSKEGWAPQTFTSSRSNRAKMVQRAEDFMDEEDLAEQQANRQLKTNTDYDGLSGDTPNSAGPSENALFKMINAGSNRIGETLLGKMGWRTGQGVGPRVTARSRQRQALELGLKIDNDQQDLYQPSVKGKQVLLAPLDRPLALYPAKDNQYGLGYVAGMTLYQNTGSEFTKSATNTNKEGGRAMPVGGAFGLGAMEDADGDDLTVYDHSERPHALTGIGGGLVHRPTEKQPVKFQTTSKVSNANYDKYNDGTPVITGFSLAKDKVQPDTQFIPPDVPADWQPDPQRIFEKADRALQDASNSRIPTGRPPEQKRVDHAGREILTASDRGKILGENKEPLPPPSVFEFISKKNQERISALIAAGKKPIAPPPDMPAGPVSVSLTVPTIDAKMAAAALKGFMPFGDDKAKQARYRFYLEAQAGLKDGVFAPKATDSTKVDQLNKELQDFAQSARVFKPMSTAMASRFTSGSSASAALDPKVPQPGLRQFVASEAPPKVEEEPVKIVEDISKLTPLVQAIRADMFGFLTRTNSDFYPNRLLCKRFNVQDPHPGGPKDTDEQVDDTEERDLLNKATMEKISKEGGFELPTDFHQKAQNKSSNEKQQKSISTVGLGEDESQGKDTLTYEKPAMELFKAIFAESEDESEDEVVETKPPVKVPTMNLAQPSHNPLEPVSLADFKPTFVSKTSRSTVEKKHPPKVKLELEQEEDAIAPVLKEKRKKSKDKSREKSSKRPKLAFDEQEADEWVEKETAQPKSGRVRAADLM